MNSARSRRASDPQIELLPSSDILRRHEPTALADNKIESLVYRSVNARLSLSDSHLVPLHGDKAARPIGCEGLVISSRATRKLVDVLTHAFHREPHNEWLFRQDGKRDEAFAHYLNIYLSEIARRGATFIMSAEMDAAAIVGSSVDADHYLSVRALIRIVPAVINVCTPWRLHRMIAMEHALSRAHLGMKHLPHLVFMGGIEPRSQSTRRIGCYLKERYPLLTAETADPRVAALACRRGAVETGRAKPVFGGPEMIFLLYRSESRCTSDIQAPHVLDRPA